MIILFGIVLGFTIIRFLVVLVNLLSNPVVPQNLSQSSPGISILIPARNEENRLENLFKTLNEIRYPDYEILILNDESEDKTQIIAENFSRSNRRARVISGLPLPPGWLGKNWACHQLSLKAQKEYFFFIDADITYIHPDFIQKAIDCTILKNLSLLSVFPEQSMISIGEKQTVPLMNYLLLTLLPLWAIYYLPFRIFSAANGQFMLFPGADYRQHQWHKKVKNCIAEDIAIMQEVKKYVKKGMTFVSNNDIRCRMYTNYKEAVEGFSKNILAIFGNNIIGLVIYLGLTILVWPLFLFSIPAFWLIGTWLLVICMRIIISLLSNQQIGLNIILHPIQMINLVLISIGSIYKKKTGSNEWKGRKVSSLR